MKTDGGMGDCRGGRVKAGRCEVLGRWWFVAYAGGLGDGLEEWYE